ncbi:hypothetical protein [Bacillus wiedmannii]|uniref:Uncharacterized protein n=1 Tax=Bacillus wiedmannii TaxID=1890302 RepID=A0A2C4PZW7_9BACI|nr:hypothetical protein [Bacillus wiedmannii]PHD57702.1 hypothetical protein COF57_22800 [Bacillus wiedmannii]
MAKLDGVKVVNENTVEYNGFVYEKVMGDAKAADVIQASEQGIDITEEAFYLVTKIDVDTDIVFKDDVNDSNYFTQGEHSVFRKSHAITNDKLTDAEGVVTITLPDGTKLEGTPSDLEKITRSMQALQNEQVATVEMPEETVEVEEAGEPVSERLQVGDYAKVITHDNNGMSEFSDIVKITEDDETDVPFNTDHLDGRYAGWHYENDLVRATEDEVKAATEPKVETLKVGDYAKVVGNESDVYEKGSIVKITDVPYGKWDYQAIGIKKDDEIEEAYEQFFERELVKATDEEVLEAKQALLKEGDFARVIGVEYTKRGGFHDEDNEDVGGGHSFENGTIVELKKPYIKQDETEDAFKAYYLDGSDWWWVHRKDLEPLTKEESEHIEREADEEKKEKAERAKWAAIGREVGEIKDGDVVKVIDSNNGSNLNNGDIGEVSEAGGSTFRVITPKHTRSNWFISERVELIVPVEQRFDTVG